MILESVPEKYPVFQMEEIALEVSVVTLRDKQIEVDGWSSIFEHTRFGICIGVNLHLRTSAPKS